MTVKKEPKKVIFHDSFNICLMTLLSLRKSASIEFVLRINKIPEILGRFTCVAYFLQCTGSITFMPIFFFMPRGGFSSRMTKIQINFTKLDILNNPWTSRFSTIPKSSISPLVTYVSLSNLHLPVQNCKAGTFRMFIMDKKLLSRFSFSDGLWVQLNDSISLISK